MQGVTLHNRIYVDQTEIGLVLALLESGLCSSMEHNFYSLENNFCPIDRRKETI